MAACDGNNKFSAGEDDAQKANLDPQNDDNEKDDFFKKNDLVSCHDSKNLVGVREDDACLIYTNVGKKGNVEDDFSKGNELDACQNTKKGLCWRR